MTSLHEKTLKLPRGQLVGGIDERYVKYADTNRPTVAKAIIAQEKTFLFIARQGSIILSKQLKGVVQMGMEVAWGTELLNRSHRRRIDRR